MWHCHFSKCFGVSNFIIGFTVTFSLRDRKLPHSLLGACSLVRVVRAEGNQCIPAGFFFVQCCGEEVSPLGYNQPKAIQIKSELVKS